MKKYLFIISLVIFGSAQAAPIILDFTSGSFSSNSYTQSGFSLATQAAGNHIDPGFIGPFGWHNGPANPVTDNNLILSFSGGAFDLTGLDFAGFLNSGISMDLTGSNGASASITSLGVNPLSFFNVTSVIFSITESSGIIGSAGLNSLSVNNTPGVVPEPATLALLGLGLVGLGFSRKKKSA